MVLFHISRGVEAPLFLSEEYIYCAAMTIFQIGRSLDTSEPLELYKSSLTRSRKEEKVSGGAENGEERTTAVLIYSPKF